MKTNTGKSKRVNRILTTLFLVALITALAAVCLTGCDDDNPSPWDGYDKYNNWYNYENSNLFTPGGAALPTAPDTSSPATSTPIINKIEIDWFAGQVNIQTSDTQKIEFSEVTDETDSQYLLHYAIVKNKLKIEYQKSNVKIKPNSAKTLNVKIPANLRIYECDVETVSASVTATNVSASEFDAETVSGAITVSGINNADKVDLETVSAAVTATNISCRKFSAESVSGTINVSGITATEIDVENSSNSTVIANSSASLKMEAESVSGSIAITDCAFGKLELENLSGAIDVAFRQGDGFRAEITKMSGTVTNSCNATQVGNVYVAGSGIIPVEIETMSGAITLRFAETQAAAA